VILLDDVIQVLALPVFRLGCQRFIAFQGFDCHRIGSLFIDGDHAGCLSMSRLQHFAEKPGCCFTVPLCAQHEVQRVAH